MLDEKDLQAIAEIMDEKIGESEARLTDRIRETEERTIQQAARNTQVIVENVVDKKLDLILEALGAQQEQMKRLAARSKVEALEDELAIVKHIVRMLSQDVAELKKAQ